jgi:hypothetical protein
MVAIFLVQEGSQAGPATVKKGHLSGPGSDLARQKAARTWYTFWVQNGFIRNRYCKD